MSSTFRRWLVNFDHAQPPRRKLGVEPLEDRLTPSWGGVPPSTIAPPSFATTVNLNSQGDASFNAAITNNEVDYYVLNAPTTGSYRIALQTPSSNVDTVLGVFNASGQRLAYNDDSGGTLDSLLTINLSAGSRYFIGATNYNGSVNGSYTLVVDGPSFTSGDDSYEDNDTQASAYNFGTLTARRTVSGLVMGDASDWYKFTTSAAGGSANYARVDFSHAQGDIDISLHDAAGTMLAYSNGVGNSEVISFSGRAAGTYFLRVYGYNGVRNPSYSLDINPAVGSSSGDDAYENNDSLSTAFNLGTLTSNRTLSNLVMADGHDWFRFATSGTGTSSNTVRISSTSTLGDLDLELYNSAGQRIGISESGTNNESLSLNGLGAGTYYVHVLGYNGLQTPNYSLSITPPTGGGGGGTGARVLYLNFDGANMSRADLVRYAGTDWASSITSYLDPEGDGIRVSAFQSGRADREQIIARMMQLLQEDLTPFGITVRRHTGGAVEGQGATTLFLGQSTLSHPHIACDIDYGNNNRTDIAFVGNEYWGTTERTALAMADVALHEAGHTFGLHHVSSGRALESMGLRYSNSDTNFWVQNTSFLNQTFPQFSNHGPGPQNAYQVMYRNFVTGAGNESFEPTMEEQAEHKFDDDFPTYNMDELPVNLGQIAAAISHSREYYEGLVRQLYARFLGRGADADGLNNWATAMERGLSREQIEAGFIGSQEYINNHGRDLRTWVRGMYHDLLGRTPAESEVEGWVNSLRNGASTYEVAFGFAASRERLNARVSDNYASYLGRSAGQSEIDGWVNFFASGARDEDLIGGFVGSEEFYFGSEQGKGQLDTWVSQAYMRILGREASQGEIDSWRAMLHS